MPYAFHDFTFDRDYRRGWVATDDPRLVAVIERDDYASLSDSFDGDAILPIYTRDYRWARGVNFAGGYADDTVADAYWKALYEWGDHDKAARFIRIFHDSEVEVTSGGYNPDFECLVFDTPDFREHIGDDRGVDHTRESVQSMATEVRHVLDGEVYGIGYAVNPARVDEETPIPDDLSNDPDWGVTIECWGFIGDEYAAECARSFDAGRPNLHPMLEGTAAL